MEYKIIINNKNLNGKVIGISEDKDKCNLKILLENIDIEMPVNDNKLSLGNDIILIANIVFSHVKIKY
ncbi:MAG TPA: hypothetical protein PK447_00370 [Ignavibacteria bacterium]|nr:hypothetical protein [Ignavibacteria bacterium]